MQHRTINIMLLVILLTMIAGCGLHSESPTLETPDCISDYWPHERSDLVPDPEVVFGRLDNGLRYVLLRNSEPENRVGLFLNIQAGSIQETEEQRGVAHYLEHMLFNGTTNYPPGTLVNYFQSIGMGFGADTNAHTSYGETVYKLVLPYGSSSMLNDGFQVLADYAAGALLLEKEVERERGIILAEKRSRDSVQARVRKQQLQFDFANTLIAARDPIGTEEVLRVADSSVLRNYYRQWYRPENMIVVVVGDMEVPVAEKLVQKHFGGIEWQNNPVVCPDLGTVEENGVEVLYIHEPELGRTSVSLGTVYNQQQERDTSAWEEEKLHEYVAVTMLGNRLEKLQSIEASPFIATRVYGGTFLERFGYASLTATTDKEHWQQGVAWLRQTLDQVLSKGFTERELHRVKKELVAYLEKQVQTARTRNSLELANSIIRKLNSGEVILAPAQELKLYRPMLDRMTTDDADRALGRIWNRERRLIQVVGTALPEGEGGDHSGAIRQAFLEAGENGVSLWRDDETPDFPYLAIPTQSGQIVSERQHQRIGVHSVVLKGGVQLNIKQTDYQDNQVMVAAHFGQGRLSEPRQGISALAQGVVNESGVGHLTREQLDEALAGSTVKLSFLIGEESFSFSGSGLGSELEQLMQLLYTRLHDPAFRKRPFDKVKQRMLQSYDSMETMVEGRQQLDGERFLHGRADHFSMASRQQVAEMELEQIVAWLEPVFRDALLEINIVGDVDPVRAGALARKYFGEEQRGASSAPPIEKIVFPAGEKLLEQVDSAVEKALITVAWKSDDFWEISRTRRFNALASVIDDRLRVKVREQLGATYSPVVYNRSSRTHAGFGIMRAQLVVAPEKAQEIAGIVIDTAEGVAQEGVATDELQRALEPTLTSIRDFQRTNGYWLNNVMALSSRYPQQLMWPLTIISDFEAITPADLQSLARQYLYPGGEATVIMTTAPVSGEQK